MNPKVYLKADSPAWWVTRSIHGKRERQSTGLLRVEFTQCQAQAIIDQAVAEETTPDRGARTLRWFRAEVMRRVRLKGRAEGTISEYELALDHLIAVYGQEYPVEAIKRDVVTRMQEYILSKGDTPQTANKTMRTLHAAWNYLIRDELLEKDPLKYWDRLQEPQHDYSFSQEELDRLLPVIDSSTHEAARRFTYCLLFLGCRLNELRNVLRQDVDIWLFENPDTKEMEKRGRLWVANNKIASHPRRRVTIDTQIISDVEWFLEHGHKDLPFAFCQSSSFAHWFVRKLKSAKIAGKKVHSLRHTFVSRGINYGKMSVRDMQYLVGHATITTTEVYIHKDYSQDESVNIGIKRKEAKKENT